jgi:hypothetical protein
VRALVERAFYGPAVWPDETLAAGTLLVVQHDLDPPPEDAARERWRFGIVERRRFGSFVVYEAGRAP